MGLKQATNLRRLLYLLSAGKQGSTEWNGGVERPCVTLVGHPCNSHSRIAVRYSHGAVIRFSYSTRFGNITKSRLRTRICALSWKTSRLRLDTQRCTCPGTKKDNPQTFAAPEQRLRTLPTLRIDILLLRSSLCLVRLVCHLGKRRFLVSADSPKYFTRPWSHHSQQLHFKQGHLKNKLSSLQPLREA